MSQQLRLQTVLNIVLSQDAAQKKLLVNMLNDGALVIDDMTATAVEHVIDSFTLAASETDYAVPFGKVTLGATVLLLGVDNDFSYKFDVSGNSYIKCRGIPADTSGSPVSSYAAARQPGFVLHRGSVSNIWLRNDDSVNPVTVFCIVLGNASA